MGPSFPQVAMFVLPLLSLLPLALSDNLWGGVQTGEAVEPSFQQAETVYSPDPAALKVEEQQYQEEPEYQQEAYPVQYQQYPEQPQQYQEPVQEYHQQPQQYLEQYQEEPAPQYQEQYHGDVQQYPGQAQHYPEQPGAPVWAIEDVAVPRGLCVELRQNIPRRYCVVGGSGAVAPGNGPWRGS